MKKIISAVLSVAVIALSLTGAACGDKNEPQNSVKLVAVTAAEAGVRNDVDYFVIPEPAASTKVNAIADLKFAGDLQELYGGDKGYPQAVVVVKSELQGYIAQVLPEKLKAGAQWLLDGDTSSEDIVSAVQSHLSEGMSPTFNAKNLSKQVIKNCSVDFVDAWECKEEVKGFMKKLNEVSQTSFGEPADNFFMEETSYGAMEYDGKISVYAPDGAPALGLAQLMSADVLLNCKEVEYKIVDASAIQTFVTGNNPKADVCVLPVNLAVKLLGSGEKYKMLGTLTHGNLYLLSSNGEKISAENIKSLGGKTVGVVNLAAVPGLTFKAILKQYEMDFTELQ
ncbi:MAG: hypothetical protein K2L42_01790 [Clostridia bacterium]|nr:hypothetical protein [Clostridia bacterium]